MKKKATNTSNFHESWLSDVIWAFTRSLSFFPTRWPEKPSSSIQKREFSSRLPSAWPSKPMIQEIPLQPSAVSAIPSFPLLNSFRFIENLTQAFKQLLGPKSDGTLPSCNTETLVMWNYVKLEVNMAGEALDNLWHAQFTSFRNFGMQVVPKLQLVILRGRLKRNEWL